MFDPKDWLDSGLPAVLDGVTLRPRPHPTTPRSVLSATRRQASVFFLTDDNQGEWILKKFTASYADTANILAVRSLVPHAHGFESAFLRRCLRRDSVSRTAFALPEFIEWVDGTLLMPRVLASDWAQMLDNVRDGNVTFSLADRVTLAENLCAKIDLLERVRIAHRDLSVTNVMVDALHRIHLIDWDSIYAPSLRMPANTTIGTDGYTAPFIHEQNDSPAATWMVGGDRFALAVLILEAFAAAPGSPVAGDGGILEQSELDARDGPGIRDALHAAAQHTAAVEPLFLRALQARGATDCPSPAEWRRSLRRTGVRRQRASSDAVSGVFVALDRSAFVQLDRSRFTQLFR